MLYKAIFFFFAISYECAGYERHGSLRSQEWQERAEAESYLETPRDDRKLIREEKARQARLAAIQVSDHQCVSALKTHF